MSLFTELQKKAIASAVQQAEARTSGELVVVHTPRSDDYALARAVFAFCVSAALVDATQLFWAHLDLSLLLGVQALLLGPLYMAASWGPLLRLLVSKSTRAERCMERALRSLVEQGVTETRDRSGVLIFLSEAEHRVVILADKGINDRVEPAEWDRDVDSLVQALKAGKATEGLLSVVERIGSLLSASFPRRDDDTNELANEPLKI